MVSAFLFSLWCASPRRSKLAHSTAVVIWVILGLTLCLMIFQVARDIEVRCVSLDTWINIGSAVLFILAFNMPWILSARRRSAQHLSANVGAAPSGPRSAVSQRVFIQDMPHFGLLGLQILHVEFLRLDLDGDTLRDA